MKSYSIVFMFLLLVGSGSIKMIAQTSTAQRITTEGSTNPSSGGKMPVIKLTDHPRLFFSKGEEDATLNKAKNNVLLSQLIDVLKKEADKALNAMPQQFNSEKQLAISREQIKRLLTLSMAYRLFKDNKYAKKAEEELINVCKFPSWHPEHFLDDAEMTTAVAIGYDWCYNFISPATRLAVENAIRENGFKPAWPIYETTDKKTPFNRENNWNMVCNSGMLNGAIAIGDKYPADLTRILQYAVKNTPHLLESFAPEGVYNEGSGYWAYNGMYMALFFDNLKRNIHNDYGLPNMKGINNTANFYMNIIGPTRDPYNFGDASERFDYSGTFFLLSKQYRQPEVAEFYRNAIEYAIGQYNTKGNFDFPRLFFLAIPWFDDAKVADSEKAKKLVAFNGMTDFIIFNGNNKADTNRLYLAAKTGKPNWSHNQLDVGSFIVESEGERWGIDLGSDNYSLPNFWDYKPGGVRWNYFRNTNLAHNTLSIDDKIANSDGQGELIRSNRDDAKPFGVFDISTSYEGQASSVLRGFKLLSQDAILIRDEITLKPNSKKVSWRFLTNADVKIDGSTATLLQNGKKFYISCLLVDGFTMKSFPAKPNSPAEKPIKDVTIVEITVNPSKSSIVIPVVIGKNAQNFKTSPADNSALNTWR